MTSATAGSPFLWPRALVSRPQRQALDALDAFRREVSGIVHGRSPLSEKRGRLAAWRREVDALAAGTPATPLSIALAEPMRRWRLPRDEFEALIAGAEMMVGGAMLAPLLCDLRLYCRRAAGSVAVLSLGIYGDAGRPAGCLALALAEGLHLTALLRDLSADAARGVLFLPRESLAEAGIVAGSPGEVIEHPALPAVCDALAAMARTRLEDARVMVPELSPEAAPPVLVVLDAGHRLLDRVTSAGWPAAPTAGRLGRLEMARILLRHRLAGAA